MHPKAAFVTRLNKPGYAGIAVSMLVLCLGIGTLAKGRLQYSNYWGGAVFAHSPF